MLQHLFLSCAEQKKKAGASSHIMPLLWCLRAEYKEESARANAAEYLCHYYKSTADHLQCNYFHAREFNKAIAHISCIISKMRASR
jgi:hypothetical protein